MLLEDSPKSQERLILCGVLVAIRELRFVQAKSLDKFAETSLEKGFLSYGWLLLRAIFSLLLRGSPAVCWAAIVHLRARERERKREWRSPRALVEWELGVLLAFEVEEVFTVYLFSGFFEAPQSWDNQGSSSSEEQLWRYTDKYR